MLELDPVEAAENVVRTSVNKEMLLGVRDVVKDESLAAGIRVAVAELEADRRIELRPKRSAAHLSLRQ